MTIYELLGLRDNKPKKIKYAGTVFEKETNGGYVDVEGKNLLKWILSDYSNIEYLHYYDANNKLEYEDKMYTMRVIDRALIEKINEIIEKINKLEEEK